MEPTQVPDTNPIPESHEPLAANIYVPKGDPISRIEAALDVAISTATLLDNSRARALVQTKAEEAKLWLTKASYTAAKAKEAPKAEAAPALAPAEPGPVSITGTAPDAA